ncbi:MAG: ABC-type transport auxiliary lipoprotein family protein [Candidatus Binatia bacterium]
MRRWALLLLPLGMLGGCLRLSQPAPAIRDYRLDYTPPAVTGAALPVILSVPPLGVAATYDRTPIVYREGSYATGTYFYERWSANPGNLVADVLARDFAHSGVYRAVQQRPSLVPSDYQLTGEIGAIEERVTDDGCSAHLDLRVLVLRVRNGGADPVVLQQSYTGDAPCRCNDSGALAAAMSRVLKGISQHLQRDVYAAIAAEVATSS